MDENNLGKYSEMRVALIAHDGKKAELVSFVLQNKDLFEMHSLFATKTTGSHLQQTGLAVTSVLSGPAGGDAQIAALVANGEIDYVFFFRDPFGKHPHEPDVQMLMRICDVHNIPLTTNLAGAEIMLRCMSKLS